MTSSRAPVRESFLVPSSGTYWSVSRSGRRSGAGTRKTEPENAGEPEACGSLGDGSCEPRPTAAIMQQIWTSLTADATGRGLASAPRLSRTSRPASPAGFVQKWGILRTSWCVPSAVARGIRASNSGLRVPMLQTQCCRWFLRSRVRSVVA